MVAIMMSVVLGFFFLRLVQAAVVRRSRILTVVAGVVGVMGIHPLKAALAAGPVDAVSDPGVLGLVLVEALMYGLWLGVVHACTITWPPKWHLGVFMAYVWAPRAAFGLSLSEVDALAFELCGWLLWSALWFTIFVASCYRHRNYEVAACGNFLWQEVIREKGWDQPMAPMSAGRMKELKAELVQWEAKYTPPVQQLPAVENPVETVPVAPPAVPAIDYSAELKAELQRVELERLRLALENKKLKAELQRVELERLRLAIDLKETLKAADRTAQEDFQERQEIVATLVARAEEAESLLRRAKAAGGLLMAEKKAAEAELEAMKAQQGLTAVVLGGGFMRKWEIPHPAVTTAEGWVAQWAITPDNK